MKKSIIAATVAILAPGLVGMAIADGDHHEDPTGQFAVGQGDISTASKGYYSIEPTHAYISFSYNHLGFSYPVLGFTAFGGSLNIDPDDLAATEVRIMIDAASIDSRVEVFDGHLKGENFFNVEEHPQITFNSTAALPESEGHGKIAGDLTIKGITKSVVLDVVLHKAGKNPISGKDVIGVSGKTTVKRSDWDLGLYAPNVSDEVDIVISAEFIK